MAGIPHSPAELLVFLLRTLVPGILSLYFPHYYLEKFNNQREIMIDCTMSTSTTPIESFLKEHPRWIGVLFTMTLLLTQAGMAAGSTASTTAGP